jgi:deoxyribodipyrimidine photo-lyase
VGTAVVLFNRDLRVHDHPALAEAARAADRVVPLFVVDDAIVDLGYAVPNRAAFLVDCLTDLRASLRERGGDLVLRQGDVVREAMAVAEEVDAEAVHASADVTAFARRREAALADACAAAGRRFELFPGVTVQPADEVLTGSGQHYKVFTPYWRAWSSHPRRAVEAAPTEVALPSGLAVGRLPSAAALAPGDPSPDLAKGGETEARALMNAWSRSHLHEYDERHDDLAGDVTSRVSPHLHFGSFSPLELVDRLERRDGGAAYARQLCWRDFHHQVTFAFPALPREDLHPDRRTWEDDDEAFEAWAEGRTGLPIVDAGMRQLRQEGWMHNRARLLSASFLTKHLGVDWRRGAEHFFRWLVDGDVANNAANWQWVAGTGSDTRPNRIFNPIRQAHRFDPRGDYVRRYVPELAGVDGAAVHEPWKLQGTLDAPHLDYPDPIVDHEAAADRFRAQDRAPG